MLPKAERLKDKRLFNLAFNKKQRLHSNIVTLYYLYKKKEINNLPKTAFIVSLKISKKSTIRNQIKRRMREAYKLVKRKLINTNNNLYPISVLIWVANPAIKNATFEQIKDSMHNILYKIKK